MKMLFISPGYAPAYKLGGVVECLGNLCSDMVKDGHQVDVVTYNRDEMGRPLFNCKRCRNEIDGVQVTYYKPLVLVKPLLSLQMIRQVIKSNRRYDRIYIASVWDLLTPIITVTAILFGFKLIFAPHGSVDSKLVSKLSVPRKTWLKYVIGWCAKKAWAIHYTTDYERSESIVSSSNYFICPNGVQYPHIPASYKCPNNQVVKLLYIGRLAPKKRLDLLFRAIEDLDYVELTIACPMGDDYAKHIYDYYGKLPRMSKIIWAGFVEGEDKWNLIASSDLVVLPSEDENFGMVIAEALGVGVPVVSSRNVGSWLQIQKDDLGFTIDLDSSDITSAIEKYRDQKSLWKSRKEYIQTRARGVFQSSNVSKMFVDKII